MTYMQGVRTRACHLRLSACAIVAHEHRHLKIPLVSGLEAWGMKRETRMNDVKNSRVIRVNRGCLSVVNRMREAGLTRIWALTLA